MDKREYNRQIAGIIGACCIIVVFIILIISIVTGTAK